MCWWGSFDRVLGGQIERKRVRKDARLLGK